jgi:hypothetical protein
MVYKGLIQGVYKVCIRVLMRGFRGVCKGSYKGLIRGFQRMAYKGLMKGL